MSMGLDSPMEALAINYLTQHNLVDYINMWWAWIAFLTAAFSFWKIKSSSSIVHSSPQHLNSLCLSSLSPSPPHQPAKTSSAADDHQQEEELPTASFTSSNSNSSNRYIAFCSMENRRSGKFSMYYLDEDDVNNNTSSDNNNNNNNLDDIDTTQSKLADRRLRIGCSIRHNNNDHPHEEEKEEDILVSRISINYFEQQQQQQREAGGWEWEAVLKMKSAEMVWYRYQDLTLLDGNVVRLWNY